MINLHAWLCGCVLKQVKLQAVDQGFSQDILDFLWIITNNFFLDENERNSNTFVKNPYYIIARDIRIEGS